MRSNLEFQIHLFVIYDQQFQIIIKIGVLFRVDHLRAFEPHMIDLAFKFSSQCIVRFSNDSNEFKRLFGFKPCCLGRHFKEVCSVPKGVVSGGYTDIYKLFISEFQYIETVCMNGLRSCHITLYNTVKGDAYHISFFKIYGIYAFNLIKVAVSVYLGKCRDSKNKQHHKKKCCYKNHSQFYTVFSYHNYFSSALTSSNLGG